MAPPPPGVLARGRHGRGGGLSVWLFCCGMQRSGSTLQFQLAARLLEDAGRGRRLEWVPPAEFPALRDRLAGDSGWKVFKSHLCTEAMAAELRSGRGAGLHVHRDLRDVMVSAMRKYETEFEDLWDGGFLRGCLLNDRRWTRLPRVLVSRYDDLVADPAAEVERIARHLDVAVDRRAAERLAADFGVERQARRIEEARLAGRLRRAHGNAEAWFDPETNLHTDHLAGGVTGGWRSILTPEQVGAVEARAGRWLIARGYELSLEPAERYQLAARFALRRLARAVRAARTGTPRRRARAATASGGRS